MLLQPIGTWPRDEREVFLNLEDTEEVFREIERRKTRAKETSSLSTYDPILEYQILLASHQEIPAGSDRPISFPVSIQFQGIKGPICMPQETNMPKLISDIRNFCFSDSGELYSRGQENELLSLFAIPGANAFTRGPSSITRYRHSEYNVLPVQYAFFDESFIRVLKTELSTRTK